MLLAEIEDNLTLIIVTAIATCGTIVTATIAGWFAQRSARMQGQREVIQPAARELPKASGDPPKVGKYSPPLNRRPQWSNWRWAMVMYLSLGLTLIFGGSLVFNLINVTTMVRRELKRVMYASNVFEEEAEARIRIVEGETRSLQYALEVMTRIIRQAEDRGDDVERGLEQIRAFQDLLTRQGGSDALIRMQESINSLLPIGSIIAWHMSFANTPGLPDGWLECNGQMVTDPESTYDGQALPDLNSVPATYTGGGRFLRGGATSGVLQHASVMYPNETSDAFSNSDGTGPTLPPSRNAHTDSVAIAGTTGSTSRPVNMSVVWIMRVK